MPSARLVVVFPFALVLAACLGGGGSEPGAAPASEMPAAATAAAAAPAPTPAPAPAPGPTVGAMNVQIAGLPANTDAHITVSGGGATQFVAASRTLANLMPGAYTVTAEPVLTGQSVMAPGATAQTIQVVAGQTANATVSYNTQRTFTIKLDELPLTGLDQPIFLAAPPGDATRMFIAERAGRVRVIQNGQLLATPFLDVATRVSTSGERGVLSFAFHPQFGQNGRFFLHFNNLNGDIVVEQFTAASANPNVANAQSVEVIRIPHPTFDNHNGGVIAFGPDGMLYVSTGDGGGGGDPMQNAQSTTRLLGKMLRIDVSTLPYRIPPSNPFAGFGRGEEIWAIGLRNPWRWSFDMADRRIYVADVGQGRFEEVNAVATDVPGVNYGWPITEASSCYPNDPCSKSGQTLPVFEFDHLAGACAVTGGYVYRGTALPELQGRYFYSDYCAGFIRSFRLAPNGQAIERVDWNLPSVGRVLSFGEDANREVYVITGSAKIYRIARQ
jgi:glucose/arabinose dehydrogenase